MINRSVVGCQVGHEAAEGGPEGGNPARNRQPPLTPGQGRRKRKVSAEIKNQWVAGRGQ